MPAGQGRQAELFRPPGWSLKCAGPHAIATPSWHQLPIGQGDEQGAASVDLLIQPSSQGGAVHCSGLLEPAAESGADDGQDTQAALLLAPTSGWYLPASHSWQAKAPDSS